MVLYKFHEVFQIPWQKKQKYKCLYLKKVDLEYRIYTRNDKYEVWCRHPKKKPYKLGIAHCMTQAMWSVYNNIMYFNLYINGDWSRDDTFYKKRLSDS